MNFGYPVLSLIHGSWIISPKEHKRRKSPSSVVVVSISVCFNLKWIPLLIYYVAISLCCWYLVVHTKQLLCCSKYNTHLCCLLLLNFERIFLQVSAFFFSCSFLPFFFIRLFCCCFEWYKGWIQTIILQLCLHILHHTWSIGWVYPLA